MEARAEQVVDGVIAGGEIDAVCGCAGSEEGGDGVGLAAVFPVGICAGADGELEGGTVASVECVNGRAGGDEGADDVVMGAPGRNVKSGGVGSQLPVAIAFEEGRGGDAERKQAANARGVVSPGEAGEQRSADCEKLRTEFGFASGEGLGGSKVGAGAGGNERVERWGAVRVVKVNGKATLFECAEDIATAVVGSHLDGVSAVEVVDQVWVGAVIEERFDHDESVVAANGVLEGRVLPAGEEVGIGAMAEGEF